MAKFRKKPTEVEGVRWTGDNWKDIFHHIRKDGDDWNNTVIAHALSPPPESELTIEVVVERGDWIIREPNGACHPCKPDIFDQNYELVK